MSNSHSNVMKQTVARGAKITDARSAAPSKSGMSFVLAIFLVSTMLPVYFFIADIRLSPTRIVLLVAIVPLLIKTVSGGAGKLRSIDFCLLAFAGWMSLLLLYHHGMERLGLAVITVVELIGGYLLGRILIRDKDDYLRFIKYFSYLLIAIAPFAVIELTTGRNLLQEMFSPIFNTYFKGVSSRGRLGLDRVMAGVEHPILFGIICSLGVVSFLYVLRPPRGKAIIMSGLALFLTFCSLSSGPLLAVFTQVGLAIWGVVTKGKWRFLAVATAITYVVVDLLSNRTPITILISYVTLDAGTAWTRVAIFKFGFEEVLRHPIAGIGLNDWVRPDWLTSSVDNFWLLIAMRYGFPGIGLLAIGLALGFWAVTKGKDRSEAVSRYRVGYLISLVGLYFSLSTVFIWGNTSCFVMFFIGAGMWLADDPMSGPDQKITKRAYPGRPALGAARSPQQVPPRSATMPRLPQRPSSRSPLPPRPTLPPSP